MCETDRTISRQPQSVEKDRSSEAANRDIIQDGCSACLILDARRVAESLANGLWLLLGDLIFGDDIDGLRHFDDRSVGFTCRPRLSGNEALYRSIRRLWSGFVSIFRFNQWRG